MRTLLDESFPPNWAAEPVFSPADCVTQTLRIFPRTAVLGRLDDLVEVGVGETVMVTPSASHAREANAALERGVAVPMQTGGKGFKEPKGAATV